MKEVGNNMFILKYKKHIFFKNKWNEFLQECRGTIVDGDYNPIQLPFTKIFNYKIEANAPVLAPDTPVVAYRKVNGFMGAITWHNGKMLISTTGSTTSDYVKMIEELIPDWEIFEDHMQLHPNYTWLFEVVHPNDPHIIPEQAGLYLLGYRKKEWNSVIEHDAIGLHASLLKINSPTRYDVTMGELEQMTKECQHEGFVAYTHDGQATKIKSGYYLIKKWLARNPNTDKIMNDAFFDKIDEEYFPLVYHIRANITEYTAMNEQDRLIFIREFLQK